MWLLGKILKFLHGLLIAALWLSPLYMTNLYLLLGAIALQTLILIQFYFTNNRCVLTMLEEVITGEKITYYEGKSMAGFNGVLAKWIGLENMLTINRYIPYIVILANSYKVSLIV